MLRRLFRPRQARASGQQLYAAVVDQARRPGLYTELGAPDRIDARFELYTLHVALVLERLKGEGEAAAETAQALFDAFVGALDDSLRELGVGDLSVAKKMRKLGEAVYGRCLGYGAALSAGDRSGLAALVGRSVFGRDDAGGEAAALAGYALNAHAALAAQPLAEILAGAPAWPAPSQETSE